MRFSPVITAFPVDCVFPEVNLTGLSLGFLAYVAIVSAFSSIMIYKVSPKYGKKNPLIYISICGSVGSLTVMSSKAFGIAVKMNPKMMITI